MAVVICWKIRIFAYWTTPSFPRAAARWALWFAEKFVSLLIEQHRETNTKWAWIGCDLLKNSYLCLLNNTTTMVAMQNRCVVICWKIRIFAYWTTPHRHREGEDKLLWFAEKFVSLLIEQHQLVGGLFQLVGCDLLKNSYLCLLNNTCGRRRPLRWPVVICWKIRIFAYWTTPGELAGSSLCKLWFAEKFVSLLIEQHLIRTNDSTPACCDLLKNSYLCLLNNTSFCWLIMRSDVVICWKIRIFAYWTTPLARTKSTKLTLWFAEKFVSLLIEQHHYGLIASSP